MDRVLKIMKGCLYINCYLGIILAFFSSCSKSIDKLDTRKKIYKDVFEECICDFSETDYCNEELTYLFYNSSIDSARFEIGRNYIKGDSLIQGIYDRIYKSGGFNDSLDVMCLFENSKLELKTLERYSADSFDIRIGLSAIALNKTKDEGYFLISVENRKKELFSGRMVHIKRSTSKWEVIRTKVVWSKYKRGRELKEGLYKVIIQ